MNTAESFDFEGAISRYFDSHLAPGELPALANWIRADPSNARTFARRALLHGQLRGAFQCDAALRESAEPTQFQPRKYSLKLRFLLATAALIPLLLGMYFLVQYTQPMTNTPIASLTAGSDARWSDSDTELALRGGDLPAGTLRLEQGRAEFKFAQGAIVLIEGPAEFEPLSPVRMSAKEGKFLCHCPTQSSHMSIVTPTTEVVDLGTEFAITAGKNSPTRVSVIEGAVKIALHDASQRLSAGEAVEISSEHSSKPVSFQPAEYAALRYMQTYELMEHETKPALVQDNLLIDPGFETDFAAGTQDIKTNHPGATPWKGTKGFTSRSLQMGRSHTSAAKIESKGNKYWPWVGQVVETGEISGKQVTASIWAMHPSDDALATGQNAILKLTFLDRSDRDISVAERHFLGESPTNKFVRGDLVTTAPAGTVRVIFSVLLNARGRNTGIVYFDDARLSVTGAER